MTEAILILVPAAVAGWYREYHVVQAFLITFAILVLLGIIAGTKRPENMKFYAKEGIVIVAFTWILWSVFGALPFYLSGEIPGFVDSLFETVSGFTTTGATILEDVEVMSRGLLFWRSFTHWIGGMGVLVFMMAILPMAENNSMHIMRAEMAGPKVGKLVPKIATTAKILYGIYFALSVLMVLFLLLGGLPLFDSVVHTFATAGTGGFGIWNSSIAYYNSVYVEAVITVFMILFGVNFGLFYYILIRRYRTILQNGELKTYLGIIAAAVLLITLNIARSYDSFVQGFRYAMFQVASIITTTGFSTADFNLWPEFSKMILVGLMFIGACAGSTGGGIKVSRVILMFKIVRKEIKQILRPRSVNVVRMDQKKVDEDTINGLQSYLIVYIIIICFSVLAISIDNFDFETTFTAVIATFNNIGPGLAGVGPEENFAAFSVFSKIVLIFDMLLGRLEIFPLIMLFSPGLWRSRM